MALLLLPSSFLTPTWRYALAGLLLLPAGIAAHMVLEGVAEVAITGVALLIFKVVTLGFVRTEHFSSATAYSWYGIGRDREGRVVASEGLVALVALTVAAAVGWLVVANFEFIAKLVERVG